MINHKSFKLSQQAVIFNEENKLLIFKNTDGVWLLPGGRVDEGEMDLENALKREIKEEANLDLREIIKPIWFDTSTSMSTYAIAFLCTVNNLDDFKMSSEHTEYKWIDKNEAEDYLYYKKIGSKIKEI